MFWDHVLSTDCSKLKQFESFKVLKLIRHGPEQHSQYSKRYGLDCPVIKCQCRKDFLHYLDQLWGTPSLLYKGNWVSFLGGKVAEAWNWPLTPSGVEVEKRVQLYFYSPSGSSWSVPGWTLPYLYLNQKSTLFRKCCLQSDIFQSNNHPQELQ